MNKGLGIGSLFDRIGGAEHSDSSTAAAHFKLVLLTHCCAESLHLTRSFLVDDPRVWIGLTLTMNLVVLSFLCLLPMVSRIALGFAFLNYLCLGLTFRPFLGGGPNHYFLELLLFFWLVFFDLRKPAERVLWLNTVRWSLVIVFFYTGFRKLLFGTYFQGTYLNYVLAKGGRFSLLHWFMDDEESARVTGIWDHLATESFNSQALFFILASNLVWIGEMALAVMLVFKRFRKVALIGVLFWLVMIETGAGELFFGLIFSAALFLFLDRSYLLRFYPAYLVIYVLVLMDRYRILDLGFVN